MDTLSAIINKGLSDRLLIFDHSGKKHQLLMVQEEGRTEVPNISVRAKSAISFAKQRVQAKT